MLPKEAIEEFKKICKQKFKKDLSDIEASRRANNLLNLYKAVHGAPLFGRIQERRETGELKNLTKPNITKI